MLGKRPTGDGRRGGNLPKPIGATHRATGCNKPPCAPLNKGSPWAWNIVAKYAPDDTVATGGPQWAAHAIRKRGGPRNDEEQKLVDEWPKDPERYARRQRPRVAAKDGGSSGAKDNNGIEKANEQLPPIPWARASDAAMHAATE